MSGYLRTQIHQFCYTLLAFPRAWQFMVNYRLWVGLRKYGWVMKALVIGGVALGIYVFADAVDWFSDHTSEPVTALFMGQDSLLLRWYEAVVDSMSEGTLNLVTLVLLEVVIYHFMRRTLAIVLERNQEHKTDFKPFLNAQVRMIVLSAVITFFGGLVGSLSEVFLEDFIGWEGGDRAFTGLLHLLFLGFVIVDNYNEQFRLSIRESWRQTWRNYVGICFGLGLPLWLMLRVPVLGTIAGPLVTSVTAAIVLRELSDLHVIGYRRSEKEQAKYERKQAKKAAEAAKKEARAARKLAR